MSEAVCPYFGSYHQMRPQGFAFLADQNNKRILWEQTPGLYKCKCGERFISEGSPEAGGVIGNYVTEGGIIRAATVEGVGVLIINKSLIRYTSSRTLPGFHFV
ncbi:hypothetical protein B4V02_00980 [Paenibacillus kribbensis]|uniref:Uncharacterized protein n=1 Tax=Paenibacillus kribbensis TaxID=172713 RepID=A0A222WG96_9BACL|nr:hypothetical protein [Paenibacillus kribbensis]ASR45379.1 hypothetical protein B4V02_00980 [Paenibacillus kribbensis]